MKKFLDLQEQKKTVAFTFGRFNPPTTGHEKLIQKLATQGKPIMVFPSHSQDAKKNPLPHARKIAYMKKMFPRYAKSIMTSKARNVFEIATELYKQNYSDIIMVVGSDRVKEFDSLLKKYDGVDGRHGYYKFDSISVVSAGERDPDAEGVEGMSASKMRAAAVANDFDSFQQGLPKGFKDGQKLFDDIRKSMNVKEQNWTDEEILRDAYIRGEIWNVGDVVETSNGEKGTIIRKGTNYVVFEDMQRVWLHDLVEEPKKITKTKQEKDVEDMKGTQPAKYYAKDTEGDEMSLATKKARARHFAKGDSRKPAPGDKGAKTRPSQYTKKFKQMYGEVDVKIPVELLKLYNLGMKLPAGSPKHKEVMKKIDDMRKKLNIKEQDKEKKPQSDVMMDREKLKDLEVKKRIATLSAKIAQDQEKLAKMQIADKQAKDRNKKESVDEISENLEKFIKTNLDKIGVDYKHDYRQGTKTHIVKIDPKDHQKVTKALKHKLLHLKILIKRMDGSKIARNPNRTYKNEYVPERKLTDAEKDKLKDLEKEVPKKDFIDRYGKEEGESIYYATLTKMAKKESLWANIHKKRQRIKQGSGERMRKKGEKGAPTPAQMKRAKGESVDEINVPAILKSLLSRGLHPKGYARMLQDYIQRVKDDVRKKHSNRFHAASVATMYGLNSVFPLVDYINKLVNKGQLPQTLMAQYDQNESYEIGKDYADHTKEIDPYSAPENESRGYFTRTKSQSSKGKKLVSVVAPDIKKKLKGIDHKIEPDSTGTQIILTVDKSNVEKVKKLVGLPNMVKVVSENYQLDEKIAGLVNKSEKTGVPYSILKKSYDRGMAAWKGGHRPGASQQQWAFARVNSMLTGGKADPDLQKQIKKGGYKKKKKASKESVEEWFSSDQTIKQYQERYGDEWLKKLNNTYEKMLSKLDESCCDDCAEHFDHMIMEAEYQGKKVKLNDPIRTSENPKKKFKVYVKNEKGTVVVVRFGDPNMGINRDDPDARKNFRARHNCDDPGPKWKARYWSCFQWRAGAKVDN